MTQNPNTQILAIMNQKGGVGKTTTAITLGHGLARRGHPTLIIDLDAQGNVADALGKPKSPGLHNLLINQVGQRAVTTSGRPNLDLILGDKHTVEAKHALIAKPFRERILAQAIQTLAPYRYVVLDVAPGVDILQISALVAASAYLIPVALDHLAVVGAGDALASAAALKQTGSLGAQFLGVLPTFWERTTTESHEQLNTLIAQFKRLVWPPIPRDTKAREAPAHGQTLWEYAPGCRALNGVQLNGKQSPHVGGYRQVVDRIIQETTP
jgi:chromosome partitioning protein